MHSHLQISSNNFVKLQLGKLNKIKNMVFQPSLTIGGRLFKTWSFFAVFDGHAGANAAKVSSTKLIETILSTDTFKVTHS